MRLAIDIREVCRASLTGKGRWTAGFVSALIEKKSDLVLFSDRPLPKEYQTIWMSAEVRIIQSSGLFWHLKVARLFLSDDSIDCYVSTVSYLVPCLLRGKKRCVTVVHDLIAFRNEPHDKRAVFIEYLTARIALRYSSLICTVSDTTKNDLIKQFPFTADKAVAIYAGCDGRIASAPSKGDGPIVCVGTLCPRKNQLRLVRAFSRLPIDLRKKHPLVLIGSRGWGDEEIINAVKESDNVSWQEGISDASKETIMADAVLCAFPSLYEGFGLPVLESFSAGIPVLTSHGGSLEEVAGDAAFIVDPVDEHSIADGLKTMLDDADLRLSFARKGLERARKYSWNMTAQFFLKALED